MAKRKADDTGNGNGENITSPPAKKAASIERKPWSADEDERFFAIVNMVCIEKLWAEAKADPVLSKRGANGVKSHWQATFKKMKSGGK